MFVELTLITLFARLYVNLFANQACCLILSFLGVTKREFLPTLLIYNQAER